MRLTTCALAGCLLAACTTADDDDLVQPPSGEPDPDIWLWEAEVLNFSDEPVAGFEVGIGEQRRWTDSDGRAGFEVLDEEPRQLDFYGPSGRVVSYPGCERERIHWTSDVPTSSARGGEEATVIVELQGYTGEGSVLGSHMHRVNAGYYALEDVVLEPEQGEDEVWRADLTVEPGIEGMLALGVVSGRLQGWGVAQLATVADDGVYVVDVTGDVVLGSYGGIAPDEVETVRLSQAVATHPSAGSMRIPLLDQPIDDPASELVLGYAERPEYVLRMEVTRNDADERCGSHQQRRTIELSSRDQPVLVPELEPLPVLGPTGGSWLFRPEITWEGFEGTDYGFGSIFVFEPTGETQSWDVDLVGVDCGVDTAVWPEGFDTLEPGASGFMWAYRSGPLWSGTCSSSIEWESF